MRYWFVAFLGLALCGASIVGIDWGMYHLMRTGSCASGGPYVSARPCPPGTALHILSLVGGIFGGLIGTGIYAARGRSGERRESPYPLPLAMWTLLFCGLAGAGLYAALGPAAGPDAPKGTAIFLAALFIPMGLAPVPFGLRGRLKSGQAFQLLQSGKRCQGTVMAVDDTGMTVNDNPRVKITVRAEPDGEPPFTIEKTTTVSRVKIPRIGDKCVVFYDAANPQGKNGITFDHVPDFAMKNPVTTATTTPPTTPPEPDGDAIEKIEKLGQLRDKGLITEAEFEMQKQRLLREV
ncbi:MAG: hypothetical protein QOJ29_1502 [Thermoleophilaceae bacterium]|jgi:hypothetical protein|nr:hypothetical protein [Thermoleophilaceae bacterium]